MTFNESIRRQARGDVKPHEHDGGDISGEIVASSLSPRAIIGLEPGLGVTVAALDTPSDQRRLAQFKCNQVDDHVEIQAAVDSLPSFGGLVVLLAGTYKWGEGNTVSLSDNMWLRGQGATTICSTVSPRVGAITWFELTGDDIVISDLKIDGLDVTPAINDNGVKIFDNSHRIDIQRLEITRLAATATSAAIEIPGAVSNITDIRIDDCYIHDTDAGIGDSNGLRGGSGYRIRRNIVVNITGPNGTGIALDDPDDYIISENFIDNVSVSGAIGIFLQDGSDRGLIINNHIANINGDSIVDATSFNIIKGNLIRDGSGVGIQAGGEATLIENNNIRGCDEHGIEMLAGGDWNTIVGNVIVGNGQGTDDTFDGILINGGDQNNIQANTIRHNAGANQHKNGINISGAGSVSNLVANNDLLNSGRTASFVDTGTTTRTISPTDVVYTENAEAGVSVASTSDITIATTDVTGIVAGDLLVAETWLRIFNESGASRGYTITIEMESFVFAEGLFNIADDDHGVFRFQWVLAVVSASDAQVQGYLNYNLNATKAGFVTGTDVVMFDFSSSDLTGTVTVALKVKSNNATTVQTAYNNGFVVRKP